MCEDEFDDDGNMTKNKKGAHLTREDRLIIEKGITNGSSKKAIAEIIGKDESTVCKEIHAHLTLKRKRAYDVDCAECATCKTRKDWAFKCTEECPRFKPFACKRRDRSPGACNGCEKMRSCKRDIYVYDAVRAQEEYEYKRRDSRVGVKRDSTEIKTEADIILPLLLKGLSPYQIRDAHPEVKMSERTMYRYIEDGIFDVISDLNVFNLRRVLKRRKTRKAKEGVKREDRGYLAGRTYEDFRGFLDANEGVSVTEMDTVYNNDPGPYIQTFLIKEYGLLLGFLRDGRTAADMKGGVDMLEEMLGRDLFERYAPVILTDRGPEFSDAEGIERRADGSQRTRVFYCDPQQAAQKGSIENRHIMLRYIVERGTDLRKAGLETQDDLNLALSHLNSAVTEKLGGNSPLELVRLSDAELFEALGRHGISPVPPDEIILTPKLLKRKD